MPQGEEHAQQRMQQMPQMPQHGQGEEEEEEEEEEGQPLFGGYDPLTAMPTQQARWLPPPISPRSPAPRGARSVADH